MRRSLVVATLAAFLLVPRASHAGGLDPLWAFFSSLWSGSTQKAGCGMGPFGQCAPAVQPKTDAGCGADPNGRCLPQAQPSSDAGGGADPNG